MYQNEQSSEALLAALRGLHVNQSQAESGSSQGQALLYMLQNGSSPSVQQMTPPGFSSLPPLVPPQQPTLLFSSQGDIWSNQTHSGNSFSEGNDPFLSQLSQPGSLFGLPPQPTSSGHCPPPPGFAPHILPAGWPTQQQSISPSQPTTLNKRPTSPPLVVRRSHNPQQPPQLGRPPQSQQKHQQRQLLEQLLQQSNSARGDRVTAHQLEAAQRAVNTVLHGRSHPPPRVVSKSPAPGREFRWVDFIDWKHDGRPPVTDMDRLAEDLESMAVEVMPTEEERQKQSSVFDLIHSLLTSAYPNCRVHLFGSAANGLSVRSSNDLDICMELPGCSDNEQKGDVIVDLESILEKAEATDVLALPKARVPVIKFRMPGQEGTRVDITINNMLACANTKLLADYCAIDPRLAKLVALVKHWAKKRCVNDPYSGTLSSYCYVLMCIHLLQHRSPPILPVLQEEQPLTFNATIDGWQCQFCDRIEPYKQIAARNTESIADLFWAFFEFWAWKHDYADGVATIRTSEKVTKTAKEWTKRVGSERHLICIEDPFVLSHDLGRTVDKQTREVLRKEFLRAATLLRDSRDPLPQVFETFKSRGHK